MVSNDAGNMVMRIWEEIPGRFPRVARDEFIVMPNHVRGIIVVTDNGQTVISLGDVVGAFKSLTTDEYVRGVRCEGWKPFDGRLWQRNYYEHIVRGEQDLARIRDYISTNVERWSEDPENPAHDWRTAKKQNASPKGKGVT